MDTIMSNSEDKVIILAGLLGKLQRKNYQVEFGIWHQLS